MFTKFRVRNFKTHLDTEIELKDLTLLIGSNNSGKTNLLKAISFFSDLIKESEKEEQDREENYVMGMWDDKYHKMHDTDNSPFLATLLEFEGILSLYSKVKFIYSIQIFEHTLRNIDKDGKILDEMDVIDVKETAKFIREGHVEKEVEGRSKNDFTLAKSEIIEEDGYYKNILRIAIQRIKDIVYLNLYPKELFKNDNANLNFLNLLFEAKQSESGYDKVMSYLRKFEESLIGISIDGDIVNWSFDMGNNHIAVLDTDEVSDGLLKAAAIALICASEDKPSIIMIDEIENGINQHNLVKLIDWLKHVSNNGKNTQFILTSHSPSVIREFSDNLDSVYTVHLKRKKGYFSEVTNLNEALKMINRLGGLKEETVEEVDGVLHIRKYALTELFYNGVLGEL